MGTASDSRVRFCETRFYRPLPDVYIEHGNYYDFWNHAIKGLWDEAGQPLNLERTTITLPVGSWYFQHAANLISIQYAYFDHLEPSMNTMRQIALLCLLNPRLILETASLTMEMLSYARKALANLQPGEEHNPVRMFEETMMDFVAFQEDMVAHKSDWAPRTEDLQISPEVLQEFVMLRDALALPLQEAVSTICTPITYQMGESVALGIQSVLKADPRLRYAIAGHTHMERIDPVSEGTQVYLNTASWTVRLSPPAPGQITGTDGPVLMNWLHHPDWNNIPLRDVTQLTFALVTATNSGPASASLCVWEGGLYGNYRVLA
jgi:hypothetical protein